MVLKDLLSISGQGGLFKFVSQGRNGVIVENIETKKRTNVPTTAKMSSLEDIAIFTDNEEIPLADVMDKIFEKENGGESISHKSDNQSLKKFMEDILPDYDKERVYVSDMKKLVLWYNLLHKNNMLIKEEVKEEESGDENTEKETKEVKEIKTKEVKPKKPTEKTQPKQSAKPKAATTKKTTDKKPSAK